MNSKSLTHHIKTLLAIAIATAILLFSGPKAPADPSPPLSMIDVEILNLTTTKVSVSWHCNVDCSGSWYLGKTPISTIEPPTYDRTNAPGDGVQALHEFVISDLTPDTDYFLRLKSSLPDGYTLISYNIKFRTTK